MAQQADAHVDRVGRGGPAGGGGQGGGQLGPVGPVHDVEQGTLLEQLGVVAQGAGDGARDRLEGAERRDQHDDGAGVVHEGAKPRFASARQLVAAALCQVAQTEQHDAARRTTSCSSPPARSGASRGADLIRSSIGDPTSLPWTLVRERNASSWSSGWTSVRPDCPFTSSIASPKVFSAERLPQTMFPSTSTRTTGSGRCRNASTMEASMSDAVSDAVSDPGSDLGSDAVSDPVSDPGSDADRTPARTRDRTPLVRFSSWLAGIGGRLVAHFLRPRPAVICGITRHTPQQMIAHRAPPTWLQNLPTVSAVTSRVLVAIRLLVTGRPTDPRVGVASARTRVRCRAAGRRHAAASYASAMVSELFDPTAWTEVRGLRIHRHHLPPCARPGHGADRLRPARGPQRLPAPHGGRAAGGARPRPSVVRRRLRPADRERPLAGRRRVGILLRGRPAHPGHGRATEYDGRAGDGGEAAAVRRKPGPAGCTSSRCSG